MQIINIYSKNRKGLLRVFGDYF